MTVINDFKTCFIVILEIVCIFPLSFIFIEEMQQHFFEAKKKSMKMTFAFGLPANNY